MSCTTAAADTFGAQLEMGCVASHGKRHGDSHVSMAAGPAADIGPSDQVGCCREYGATYDVNWVQNRAGKRVEGGAVGNNGHVISSSAVPPSRLFGYFKAIWARHSVVRYTNRSPRLGMAGRRSGDTIILMGCRVPRQRQSESSSHNLVPGFCLTVTT